VIDSMGMLANVTVTYGPTPKLEPWVPLSMDESYRWTQSSQVRSATLSGAVSGGTPVLIAPAGTIDGHATYKNFRTFSVSANTIIKK
jgi:hypothetical protein